MKVDLVAPPGIHDSESDFAALCEKSVVTLDQIPPPGENDAKFVERPRPVNHLWPAKDYFCTLPMLNLLLNKGYKLKKVSRVIRFKQSPWMKLNIEHKARARDLAKTMGDDFLIEFLKMANNAGFGKSVEDVRRHFDYCLATSAKDAD